MLVLRYTDKASLLVQSSTKNPTVLSGPRESCKQNGMHYDWLLVRAFQVVDIKSGNSDLELPSITTPSAGLLLSSPGLTPFSMSSIAMRRFTAGPFVGE